MQARTLKNAAILLKMTEAGLTLSNETRWSGRVELHGQFLLIRKDFIGAAFEDKSLLSVNECLKFSKS